MNGILDVPVSFYKGIKSIAPVGANLLDLLTGNGHEKYKDAVLAVRAEADPVKQKTLKDALPMYTISGLFFTAGSSNIYAPTSLIGIDIDQKDNTHVQNFDQLKECIKALPFVAYCGYSCRGKGYFCIVPVEDWCKHKEHFDSLILDFKQWGVNIDKGCRDIGRRRFVSYDPEPYINQDAEVYKYIVKPEHVLRQRGVTERTPEEIVELAYVIGQLISIIREKQIDITKGRDNWVKLGFVFVNEFGELGRDMFHEISKHWIAEDRQKAYDFDETDKCFDELTRSSKYEVYIGSFFRACKHYPDLKAYLDCRDFSNININD